jgi:hypothetical protein
MAQLVGRKRWWLFYPAVLSLEAGVLASCVANPPQPLAQSSAVRPVPPQPVETVPRASLRPAHKPAPPSPVESAAPTTGEQTVAMAVPKPTGGTPSPEAAAPAPALASPSVTSPGNSEIQLIGLDQPAATRLFGPATERSEQPPATVWRYKAVGCELELFFYLDLRSGRMRTLHYALKGDANGAARQQDCLRSLLASR